MNGSGRPWAARTGTSRTIRRRASDFWQLGAIAAIPAGQSVVEGGTIPYKPEALAKRDENRAGWPKTRSRGEVLHARHPARDLHAVSVPDRPGRRRHPVRLRVREREPRRAHGKHEEPPVDSWMGWSNGQWEGDTLVIEVTGFNDRRGSTAPATTTATSLKVTERLHARGREPHSIRGDDRRSGDVLAAVEDQHAALPAPGEERPAAGVQVRASSPKSCSTGIWNESH